MNQDSSTDRRCFTCGATAGEEDIYCRHCGSRLPVRSEGRAAAASRSPEPPGPSPTAPGAPSSPAEGDAESIYVSADPDQETATRETIRVEQSSAESEQPYSTPARPPYYEPAASSPPRSRGSNRVWWIVGGVILLFILLCCCMIMLIAVVAGSDETFQDELQSIQPMISALLR